jgi:hypothetical protein
MDEELKTHLAGMQSCLVERMRVMPTELLRGFESFSAGRSAY